MNVETRLTEIIGDAGARLHTARSRNDQVATDLRLYARDAGARARRRQIAGLQRALVAQARAHVDTLMPGYTHLQRAQPVRLAHHLLAYVRDAGARSRAARRRGAAHEPVAARLGRAGGDDVPHRSRGDGARRSASTASTRQQPRRGRRSRLRGRAGRGVRAAAGAPVAAGRGAGPVGVAGVRLRAAARGLLLGLVDHAAEGEPRRARAGARQGRPRDRRSDDAARRSQGAAARLQQGSAGDAGAALRRGRDGAACARARWRA